MNTRRRRRFLPILIGLSLSADWSHAAGDRLTARHLANNGFEFSKDEATLLVDFPYQSGAYGYREYPADWLVSRDEALCLFTHHHEDHFDTRLVDESGCQVAGPAALMDKVAKPLASNTKHHWRWQGADITCLPTQHANIGHCSWQIQWGEAVIFVAGDVEELSGLDQMTREPTVAILPIWLAGHGDALVERYPGAEVWISHQGADQSIGDCEICREFEPGQVISWND